MEPVIRNIKNVFKGAGIPTHLISVDDNPPTCTLTHSVIEPGKSSSRHAHPWEHEVYILEGSGVLLGDGKEYAIKAILAESAERPWPPGLFPRG